MTMMKMADKQPKGFCVSWVADGKSFVIHDPDTFTRKVVPKYFKPTKFSSFTRKLYRWGFRQVNRGIGPDDPVIFGNEFFQRDQEELMTKMRSTTAARSKNFKAGMEPMAFGDMDPEQNRMLLDRLYQEKTMGNQYMGPALQYPMRPGMMPMYMPYGNPAMMSPGFMPPQNNIAQQPQQGQGKNEEKATGSSSPSEIVNAAINALRHAV